MFFWALELSRYPTTEALLAISQACFTDWNSDDAKDIAIRWV